MKLKTLAELSLSLAAEPGRSAKVLAVAGVLAGARAEQVATITSWLVGELTQGKVGLGWAALQKALAVPGGAEVETVDRAGAAGLEIIELDQAFTDISAMSGAGSAARKLAALSAIIGRADGDERRFIAGLVSGELRQGAQEGLILAATAKAFGVPEAAARRAVMMAGSLQKVAGVLAIATATGGDGQAALAGFGLELFRPVQPMLADTAEDLESLASDLADMLLEPKLDGARVQVHKSGEVVRCWSRALNEVTAALPEVVSAVRALAARDLVLDGEVIALGKDGGPLPFQTTMRRFGRKLDVDAMVGVLPVTAFFFDVLRLDGETLIDRPLAERRALLERLVRSLEGQAAGLAKTLRVTRGVAAPTLDEAQAFLDETLAAGHEGIVAKRLSTAYEAGQRKRSWLKLKPAKTLDLVVVGVEVGSGRRSQWLSNLHLAARHDTPEGRRWVMLGKTFKGMTDELLVWQTRELGAREVRRDGHVVQVRPELVVEVAFQELEASPRYPGGVALRFARVKGYRHDKGPDESDTLETVLGLFAAQGGRAHGVDEDAGAARGDGEKPEL